MIQIYNEGEAILQGMSLVEKFEHIPLLPYGREKWKTAAAGEFCIHTEFARVIIEIDAGFETDLDTVPREIPFLYSWLKGRTRTSAVIHDAMYRAGVDREVADYVFLRAMQLEGVKIRYRYAIFLGVRFFGKKFYERVKSHAA